MTIKRKLFAVLSFVLIFANCKKEKNASSSPANNDNCVSGQSLSITNKSVGNIDIIPGQYIVSYNSSAVNARTISKAKLDQLSNNILQKHNIHIKALQQSFAGEPGGFIENFQMMNCRF